jgi:hypothetical protein
MDDTCVCCGEYVPEGKHLCSMCENKGRVAHIKSETLIIGYDRCLNNGASVLSVARSNGSKLVFVKNFYGETAIKMYERLTT